MPGDEVHAHLLRHPEQRDAVYARLVRTEPALIHHLETWQRRDEAAAVPAAPFAPRANSLQSLLQRVDFVPGGPLMGASIPAAAPPPDPAQEAERLLKVGQVRWGGDNFEARQAAYADALTQGDAAWQNQLLSEILERDPDALGSWLEPGHINQSVAGGDISEVDRTRIAQNYISAFNAGLIPSFTHPETGVEILAISPVGAAGGDALAEARRVDDFLDFVDAAGSNAESREFRLNMARHLNESYGANDRLPVYEPYAGMLQTQAATAAALLVTGDQAHPEWATNFLAGMDATERERFLDQVENGSWMLSADFLQPQLDNVMQGDAVDSLARPDALSLLVEAVADSQGADAEAMAVALSRAPGDHPDWFRDNPERASAWSELLASHSQPILDELTDPAFLPVYNGAYVEPAFKDGTHDLGALLRLINEGGDAGTVERARDVLTAYAADQRAQIGSATRAEDAIEAGGRLGILAAGVTESLNLAFEEHAQTQEQKRALVGFALDLLMAAVPAGGLAKSAIGDWLKSSVGSAVAREALDGFSGQIIDEASGGLTDAAKAYILGNLGDGDLDLLVAGLQESNAFISDELMSNLPAPGYERTESGREDTIQNVRNAYQQALNWITR